MSCVNAPDHPATPPDFRGDIRQTIPDYAWTDITYLLHKHGVSWRYYVFKGTEPDCEDDAAISCKPMPQNAKTPGIWNPLPYFATVREDCQLGNITSLEQLLQGGARRASCRRSRGSCRTKASASIRPGLVSRRPGVRDDARQRDHAQPGLELDRDLPVLGRLGRLLRPRRPPTVDENGYGLRVPGLVISPYAKRGYIDHQTLSFDAYAEVHRGRLPRRPAARPANRRPARPAPRRPRGRADPRQPRRRLRLHPEARPPLILHPHPARRTRQFQPRGRKHG